MKIGLKLATALLLGSAISAASGQGAPAQAKLAAFTIAEIDVAFYVLAGRVGQKTPHGIGYADAGQSMNGHGADLPMEVFSSGTTNLDQIVLFVVDASRPFSSPAKFD